MKQAGLRALSLRADAWLERAFEWTASEQECERWKAAHAHILLRSLLLYLTTRDWIRWLEQGEAFRLCLAGGLSATFLVALTDSGRRLAVWGALAVLLVKCAWIFPDTSNHFLVEVLCVALLAATAIHDTEERALLLRTLRWLPVVVLLWSGLQKIRYGTYWDGSFLASAMNTRSFADVFSLLLSDADMNRVLQAREAGLYRLESLTGRLVSNGVYVAEIVAAALLLSARLRLLGVTVTLILIAGIEAGARELLFGLLLLILMSLFVPPPHRPWLLWFTAACCATLLVGTVGLIPLGSFN